MFLYKVRKLLKKMAKNGLNVDKSIVNVNIVKSGLKIYWFTFRSVRIFWIWLVSASCQVGAASHEEPR